MTKIKSEPTGPQAAQTKAARRIHRQSLANARRAASQTGPEPTAPPQLSDWPDDPSPEEIRCQGIAACQQLLDKSRPPASRN
jgi:hypothetical protein